MKLKSWQWFALLYIGGILCVSTFAYGIRFIISGLG